MMILALQVHVLRERKWSILKTFAPDDRSTALSLYVSLVREMGYDGKKLVEEAVRDNGLMFANTVSLQIFDPDPTRRGRGSGGQVQPARAARQGAGNRRIGRGRRRKPARAGVVESLFSFLKTYGQKLRGSRENAFRETKTVAFAPHGDPERIRAFNRSVNQRSDAYTARYADEDDLTVSELMRAESTEVLGTAFFDFVHDNLVTEEMRDDARFRIGICCFVVSALIRIENELDLEGDRGRALLTDALRIFLLDDTAVETFIARLAAFLSQPASARFIKAGARCFELFESGDLDGLAERFRETFEQDVVDRSALADSQEVAIFVIGIADPQGLRSDYGNVGVQAAVDHMSAVLADLHAEHGGRTLKAMGDSLMCAARRPGAMVEIAVGLLQGYQADPARKGVPPHGIRIGGHFGRAVARDGDYFGAPVQVAASLAAAAGAGEACFPARLEHVVSGSSASRARPGRLRIEGSKSDLAVLYVQ